jgi:DNA-binding response OmpR family regulator
VKVLVADDDVDLLDLLSYALRREGFVVRAAAAGQQARQRWEADSPDIVILDGNMPKLDGFEVCRRIRHESATPVIMLTARDEDDDIVKGLQLGADDYVTKPFSAKQLVARMRSVLRRAGADAYRQTQSQIRVGDLTLDLNSQEAKKGDELLVLTRLEFRILYMLAMNPGRVVPYSRLIEYVWGYYNEGSASLLKTHVSHIRRKLGVPLGAKDGPIKGVLGVGYMLASDASEGALTMETAG